jgi:hypothetical protein
MRRCPSCGYALGVDASDGHEVVCAECGAAWAAGSLGRFGVAHAEAGEAMSIRQAIHAAAGHRSRRRDAAGRPYGSTLLAQRREPNQRWRDVLWARARRAEAIGIALLLGLFAAGIALALAAPGRAIAATSLVVLPSLGFVLFMVRLVRMRRMLDRLRLRVRRCLACESRLRPDGERLRCDACDAAWRRPERGRDTLRR